MGVGSDPFYSTVIGVERSRLDASFSSSSSSVRSPPKCAPRVREPHVYARGRIYTDLQTDSQLASRVFVYTRGSISRLQLVPAILICTVHQKIRERKTWIFCPPGKLIIMQLQRVATPWLKAILASIDLPSLWWRNRLQNPTMQPHLRDWRLISVVLERRTSQQTHFARIGHQNRRGANGRMADDVMRDRPMNNKQDCYVAWQPRTF